MQQAQKTVGYRAQFADGRLARAAYLALASLAISGCVAGVADIPVGGEPAGSAGSGGASSTPDGPVDPGRVAIHRLNNTEYNNTVRDLLGTSSKPAAKWLAEEGLHFDNTATALVMTPAQYSQYLKAAEDLITEALANPTQSARFLSCTPSVAADPCARQIIENFGKRIYRRPLEASEITRAVKVYDADIARAQSGTQAIAQALRAMLSAASFLYRIEYDANPASTAPHALGAYELASRLSYLHWSSMPDDALFEAAENGELSEPAQLEAMVDRLLADGKGTAFGESFAGQWLGIRKLITHSITGPVFPTYTTALSDAMMGEGYLWFQEFLSKDRPLTDWFTADFNFVNDALATHYGFPLPGSSQLVRVEVKSDQRVGFLGLGSTLTQTSFPSRTSPTTRGAWILSELLCAPPPPPPGNIPKLEESADPSEGDVPTGSENVRLRLERHRKSPSCSACHNSLDPMGLGLERFDGIGRYRESYPNGDVIAPEGLMPDGTPFAGPQELGALIGKDPRFTACVTSKLFSYALGRDSEAFDKPSLERVNGKWAARGLTLKQLIKEVVLSDAFRMRRGEAL